MFEASVLETPKVQCMQKHWYVFWNLRAWFWASQTQKLLHGTGLPDLGVPITWQRLHEGVSATTICCHAPEFTRMIILEVINQLFISESRQERKHVVPELQHEALSQQSQSNSINTPIQCCGMPQHQSQLCFVRGLAIDASSPWPQSKPWPHCVLRSILWTEYTGARGVLAG